MAGCVDEDEEACEGACSGTLIGCLLAAEQGVVIVPY